MKDIWKSIEWRKVLKEITEKAYWNYQGPLEIHLSDYVTPEEEPMMAAEDVSTEYGNKAT